GYPGVYVNGKPITIGNTPDSIVFHAGTKTSENHAVVTNGGRVIAVTSYGNNKNDALALTYNSIKNITFDGMYYRKDIGFDL
ncbi:MAG TPA: phosphoribosylglycinamide synthetase C domain-containing protein, partial [Bacteroidales bacterium]|nr:phosphoribosylglycinamide synthetase C domain-containing protein [Bacteroidales bacterium]